MGLDRIPVAGRHRCMGEGRWRGAMSLWMWLLLGVGVLVPELLVFVLVLWVLGRVLAWVVPEILFGDEGVDWLVLFWWHKS